MVAWDELKINLPDVNYEDRIIERYRKANREEPKDVLHINSSLNLFAYEERTPTTFVLHVLKEEMLCLNIGSPTRVHYSQNNMSGEIKMDNFVYKQTAISLNALQDPNPNKLPLFSAKSNLFTLPVFLFRLILIKTHTPSKGPDLTPYLTARKEPSTLTQRVGHQQHDSTLFGFIQFSISCEV